MMIIQGVKMALKFRGNSQIRNSSILLTNIKDVQAGTIIGRPSGIGSGDASSISGENVRINSELHTTDNVEFGSTTLNGNLSIKDSNESEKFSVDSDSGNAIIHGTLKSKGDFAVGNDQLTISSSGALDTNSSISATGALTAASANFGTGSGTLVAGASTLASVDASSGSVQAGSFSSNAVTIGGGAITSTTISGSTGSFTTLSGSSTMDIQSGALSVDGSGDVSMSGDLSVTGSLSVLGSLTTIDTTELVIEDSLIQLAKGNTSNDNMDIGFVGKYASTSGGSSDGDDLGDSWSDVSSDDFSDGGVDYNYSATYSSSYGGSAKLAITSVSGGSGNSNRSKMSRDVDATGGNLSQSGNYQLKATINFPDLNSGSFSGRIAVWDYGTTSFGLYPDKYQSFGSGSLTSGDEVTLTFQVDNDMASGVVLVVETWGGGSFGGIYVSDVHLTDPSGSTIFHQDGFEGDGGSSSTTTYYTGLVRDASDSDKKFHLFTTSEDLSSSNSPTFTSGAGYSKATLVADIEGDLTGNADSADAWSSSRTVTFGTGDVTGSFSIDGSANVSDVDLTIEDSSVTNSMLGGSIAIGKIDFLNTSAALGTSNDVVPSQAAVKSYVDAAVSSGGLTDLEVGDMQMVHSDGGTLSFTKVKEIISKKTVSSDDQTSGYISLSTEVESAFENKSQVYLNGQKLRYSSDTGTNNDYWFTASDAGATRYSNALTASDAASQDFFGSGVGLSNDGLVLAVGASRWEGDSTDQGGVYIYDWDSDNEEWDQRGSVITAPDAENTDRFGESTSLNSDGTIMATGAMMWDDEVSGQGAAYVFEYSNNSWSQKGSTLSHPSPTALDYHTHVSISGNGLVLSVGVYCYDGDAGANQGATFVYDWDSRIEDWVLRTYGTIDETTYSETDFINDYDSNYGNTAGPIEYLGDGIVLCGSSGGSNCKVYRSTDNGENWTSALSLSGINYVAGIKHIGSGIVLVTTGGHSADGDVYRSTDYGQNWTNVSNDASHDNTMHVEYLGDGICVFGSGYNPGDGFVYRSTDSGATWAKTDTDNNIFGSGSDASGSARTARFKYLGGGICLGLRYTNHSTGQWRVIRSTDYGATWADIAQTSLVSDTPCHPVVEDLGGGRVLLLHPNLSSSSMYVSTDYGQTFDTDSVFTVSTRLRELKHIGNNRVLTSSLTSSAGGGELYESTDGGDNWNSTAIFDPGMKSIVDFTLDYDKNTILVAGEKDNGSATVYVLGDDSGADNALIPSDIAAQDFYGRDTSLSNDGSVLIVGSALWEGDTTNQGSVYVYDWNSSTRLWVQRGNPLETAGSEAANDYFGFSCQINSDATIMVVSKYQLANGGGDEGEVEIYDWNSGTSAWDLRLTISNPDASASGTKNQYAFGYKVSIDGDGDVLTIAERGSGYNNFAGRVQTYSISTDSTRDKLNFNSGTISENDKLEIRYFIKS